MKNVEIFVEIIAKNVWCTSYKVDQNKYWKRRVNSRKISINKQGATRQSQKNHKGLPSCLAESTFQFTDGAEQTRSLN